MGQLASRGIPQHYQASDHGNQYVPYEQFQALYDRFGDLGNTLHTVVTSVDHLAYNFMNDFHYTPPPPPENDN